MPALYLRPLDPADPNGLLAPSPGGGSVPIAAILAHLGIVEVIRG